MSDGHVVPRKNEDNGMDAHEQASEDANFLRKKANPATSLCVLDEQVRTCAACPALVKSRTKTVFGEGNPNASVMFIGEGPGRNEDEQGRPFVGEAGKLLDGIIQACGWKRSEVYIANTVKCRPPNNRVPTQEEAANCRGFIDRQIEIINPDYIVMLGSTATQNLLGMPVSQARGSWHAYKGIPVIATWHPASILYKQSDAEMLQAKREVWSDMKLLLEKWKNSRKLT